MYIRHLHIENFKRFKGSFDIDLNEHLNVLVGDNEVGKSTVVEAIYLALTGIYNGHYLRNELSHYIFNNEVVDEYLQSLRSNQGIEPPKIIIEIFFEGDDAASYMGDDNYTGSGACGIRYMVCFDEQYNDEYQELITNELKTLPIEYYKVSWSSFARHGDITSRSILMKASLIDSDRGRLLNGSDIIVSKIVRDNLDTKEVVGVMQAFRSLQETFMGDQSIQEINNKIQDSSKISEKTVEISVDLTSRNAWESYIMTYLNKVPFPYIGKGEQSLIKTKLALSHKRTVNASIVLMEEPENHLSHSTLNALLHHISNECAEKQLLVTTHSSFVSNKLGLDSLILLKGNDTLRLNELSSETSNYFKILPGYNTLRMLLCRKSILVEGPSDELIVQRAYRDSKFKLPIQDGIDVITVGNLSFLRFLEIAKRLDLSVAVVTDNDGNYNAIRQKYADYWDNPKINICCDSIVDTSPATIDGKEYNCNTLEPKLLKENSRETLSTIFGKSFSSDDELRVYMKAHKTECALAIFESSTSINYPQYIKDSFE